MKTQNSPMKFALSWSEIDPELFSFFSSFTECFSES